LRVVQFTRLVIHPDYPGGAAGTIEETARQKEPSMSRLTDLICITGSVFLAGELRPVAATET
jgi:hypothetical protein